MKNQIAVFLLVAVSSSFAFTTSRHSRPQELSSHTVTTTSTSLNGLFDGWRAGGSGKDRLDEEWEAQQEILRNRNKPQQERDAYFAKIAQRRRQATEKEDEMWGWQKKQYSKGEDPINEWRKRRESGQISDLDDQYGDPKKIGGIPLPMPSFGVGGEFGVGGKYDNGGRFDLRLPYAEQGYVDEDADVMGKLANFFSGGKKKEESQVVEEEPPKKMWPWEK